MLHHLIRRLRASTIMAAVVTLFGCADGQPGNEHNSQLVGSSCTSQATPRPPVIAPVAIPATPLILDASPVSLQLTAAEDRSTAQRLVAIAQSEGESVLLQLRCVQADRQPGAIWEVYVGMPLQVEPDAQSQHFVGTVALLSDGIRSESNHQPFAEFVFVLDRAIAASSDASQLSVTFVPSSGVLVAGRTTPADVRAPVRIGEMNLLLDASPRR